MGYISVLSNSNSNNATMSLIDTIVTVVHATSNERAYATVYRTCCLHGARFVLGYAVVCWTCVRRCMPEVLHTTAM